MSRGMLKKNSDKEFEETEDAEETEVLEKPKKRGRPPKKKESNKVPEEESPKQYKFLGYCPYADCHSMICELDSHTKTIYVCPNCGKSCKINTLQQSRDTGKPIAKTKSEFLNTQNLSI